MRIETERLILREFTLADAPAIHEYVSDWDVASTTANIPHPYEPGMAEAWIREHAGDIESGVAITLAITSRTDGQLIGSIALRLTPAHARGELGYWIGKPHWGRGYVTEATAAVIRYGFETIRLNRIEAHHLSCNPASGRVMRKLGMWHEGVMRDHVIKWGKFEDVESYAILRRDWVPDPSHYRSVHGGDAGSRS